jgi:hypothetical protein
LDAKNPTQGVIIASEFTQQRDPRQQQHNLWSIRAPTRVITTNQATLWGALGVMKLNNPMPGLGRLLEQMPR